MKIPGEKVFEITIRGHRRRGEVRVVGVKYEAWGWDEFYVNLGKFVKFQTASEKVQDWVGVNECDRSTGESATSSQGFAGQPTQCRLV